MPVPQHATPEGCGSQRAGLGAPRDRYQAGRVGVERGANLGANLTPIGALAGITWMTILSDKEVRITFPEFVKYDLLVTPASLLACLGVLALQLAVRN